MTTEITCAIVLYNNDSVTLQKAINSLLHTGLNIRVYLIDNSLNDTLKQLAQDSRIEYIHNPSNPGFGAAHNVAIKHAMESGSNYHFIVNPDIYFTGDVITPMVNYMAQHADVGMMMPEVLNDDGTIQYLPKLLPSPFWILRRKLKQPKAMHERFVSKYELRNVPADIQYNAPILSGCFTLLSLKAIEAVGAYDDSYFMYFEDFDLSRRIHQKYKTIYFPTVSIYHSYDSGANKSSRLFRIFVSSAVTYFNKWGWFFDRERIRVNKDTLKQFES